MDWLKQFPQVLETTIVGEDCSQICVETASPNDADFVRALLSIVPRDTEVFGTRVYVS